MNVTKHTYSKVVRLRLKVNLVSVKFHKTVSVDYTPDVMTLRNIKVFGRLQFNNIVSSCYEHLQENYIAKIKPGWGLQKTKKFAVLSSINPFTADPVKALHCAILV